MDTLTYWIPVPTVEEKGIGFVCFVLFFTHKMSRMANLFLVEGICGVLMNKSSFLK